MKVICAWCKKVLSDNGVDDNVISHGCCDDCIESVLRTNNDANEMLDKTPAVGPVRGSDPRD